MPKITESVLNRVTKLKAEGLTYRTIAQRMSLSETTVAKVCQGKRGPTVTHDGRMINSWNRKVPLV